MRPHILLVNYNEGCIPDLGKSKFHLDMEFKKISSARELDFPASKKSPDVVVIFMQKEKQDCLNKIAYLTKSNLDKEIIAAVPVEMLETGVKALQNGASDFFTYPSCSHTLDFYINRSLERKYLHKHICFNENCYKSRYAISEKNYKHLFDEVPCFIYVLDRDYQITDCNRKFEEYFGNHIGEYCFGILKNRDEPCTKCTVDKTFKDGKNHASEMQIISSDGVKHTVLCWIAPIKDDQGQITHALVMLTDITEARRLEDHLTSLGFMIGSISHGIKGLLTSLDGGMYLMEKGINQRNQANIRQGFEQSKQMTERIKQLVLDILYYTKTRKVEWSKVSIKQFLEDTVEIVSSNARKNKVTIDYKLEVLTEDIFFDVDEKSLQTALVNILENGIEACVDNPVKKKNSVLFHARMDRDKVLFTIQDNGLGMDEDTLKNIFTIFFSSKGNKGTGLGLYIANKVVAQHRGEIKAKSTKNKGTKFLIKIPRTVPKTARNPRGVAYPE
ncbi:MAG: PAS domain-containing sensor histidine kinase [Desulfobacteraceae bacterium]|nr:PAS domain-containing sensor histidine kinase [Desulfobacteraceae bacterium]